jgi:hypothetical protein
MRSRASVDFFLAQEEPRISTAARNQVRELFLNLRDLSSIERPMLSAS